MSLSKNFKCLLQEYTSWVRRNPKNVKLIESYSAILLHLFVGKISHARITFDWLSSTVKLIALINNNILHSHSYIVTNNSDIIKLFTSILEYFEIPLERTVQHLWGERKKWNLIIVSQCFKFLSKFVLLFYYKERLVRSPYTVLKPHPEKIVFEKCAFGGINQVCQNDLGSVSVLKRSGRVMRKGNHEQLFYPRMWEPPVLHSFEGRREIDIKQLSGELLYIAKPLLTLAAIKKYGYGTWKPWLFSLLMDIASIHLIHNPTHRRNAVELFPRMEYEEMTMRRTLLLLYLLRAPFYESYIENRLKNVLRSIPILGSTVSELDIYLAMYFTLWSK